MLLKLLIGLLLCYMILLTLLSGGDNLFCKYLHKHGIVKSCYLGFNKFVGAQKANDFSMSKVGAIKNEGVCVK